MKHETFGWMVASQKGAPYFFLPIHRAQIVMQIQSLGSIKTLLCREMKVWAKHATHYYYDYCS